MHKSLFNLLFLSIVLPKDPLRYPRNCMLNDIPFPLCKPKKLTAMNTPHLITKSHVNLVLEQLRTIYLPSSFNLSFIRPSLRLATTNHTLLIQQRITPTQLADGILKTLMTASWKAVRGTETNVVERGDVILTMRSVDVKVDHEPMPPNSAMDQKKGRSRKGMLW
jgi:hypothetical protein